MSTTVTQYALYYLQTLYLRCAAIEGVKRVADLEACTNADTDRWATAAIETLGYGSNPETIVISCECEPDTTLEDLIAARETLVRRNHDWITDYDDPRLAKLVGEEIAIAAHNDAAWENYERHHDEITN